MEVKHTNFKGEIILKNKLNHVQLLFLNFFCKIKFKNKSSILFSPEFAKIAPETRSFITFTLPIQMK